MYVMQMCCTADSCISNPQKREETLEKHLKVIEHRENHERKPREKTILEKQNKNIDGFT